MRTMVSRLGCIGISVKPPYGAYFHGLVLSDKVKGTTAVVLWVESYGRSKEAEPEASEPLQKCRKQL